MNIVSRGIRNALRNMTRTGSIVLILSLSIGLIIAMLAARQAVNEKIATVKSSTGNTISVSPAGLRGFDGGGTALTTTQMSKLSSISHVTKVVSILSDRLTSSDTSLQSGIDAGSLGKRNASTSGVGFSAPSDAGDDHQSDSSTSSSSGETQTFTMPVTVTGTTDVSSIETTGTTSVNWKSGSMFTANSGSNVAVVGSAIASKNSLSVGSTFTAYSTTFKVVGIYDVGNTFNNNGVYIPLATLQKISSQSDSITSATISVDSSDNLASVTSAIKSSLGTAADVTNSADVASATTAPLKSVASIALFSLIGAIIAGAVIILLTMLMVVRERRREIGVMKAIGASNLNIMWQFVVESITLTAFSLVIGTGVGIAAAAPITATLINNSSTSSTSSSTDRPGTSNLGSSVRNFSRAGQQAANNITASVGGSTLAYGVGATLIIAILGSAIPSLMISKIKPADAMRNE